MDSGQNQGARAPTMLSLRKQARFRISPDLPMPQLTYTTPGGIVVTRSSSKTPFQRGLGHLLRQFDFAARLLFIVRLRIPGTLLALGFCGRLSAARNHSLSPECLHSRTQLARRGAQPDLVPATRRAPTLGAIPLDGLIARRPIKTAACLVSGRRTKPPALRLLGTSRASG